MREYQKLSPEGQRAFDRWLKTNAIFGAILAVGMLAMALAHSPYFTRSGLLLLGIAGSNQVWREYNRLAKN
jgi:hypothetical protein